MTYQSGKVLDVLSTVHLVSEGEFGQVPHLEQGVYAQLTHGDEGVVGDIMLHHLYL